MNPNRDEELERLLNQIQNPDLKVIALILVHLKKDLDGISKDISEIKSLMKGGMWHRGWKLEEKSKALTGSHGR